MLYDKQVRRICAHCEHAQPLSDIHDLCRKLGPVSPDFTCSRFKYDPLRRTPPRPARLAVPTQEGAFKL